MSYQGLTNDEKRALATKIAQTYHPSPQNMTDEDLSEWISGYMDSFNHVIRIYDNWEHHKKEELH